MQFGNHGLGHDPLAAWGLLDHAGNGAGGRANVAAGAGRQGARARNGLEHGQRERRLLTLCRIQNNAQSTFCGILRETVIFGEVRSN